MYITIQEHTLWISEGCNLEKYKRNIIHILENNLCSLITCEKNNNFMTFYKIHLPCAHIIRCYTQFFLATAQFSDGQIL